MCQHVPLREAPRVAPPPPVIPMVRQPGTDAAAPLESIIPAQRSALRSGPAEPGLAMGGHAVPASVAPTKPPLDAGADGGAPLPPVPLPDGGLLHDAAAPMK